MGRGQGCYLTPSTAQGSSVQQSYSAQNAHNAEVEKRPAHKDTVSPVTPEMRLCVLSEPQYYRDWRRGWLLLSATVLLPSLKPTNFESYVMRLYHHYSSLLLSSSPLGSLIPTPLGSPVYSSYHLFTASFTPLMFSLSSLNSWSIMVIARLLLHPIHLAKP